MPFAYKAPANYNLCVCSSEPRPTPPFPLSTTHSTSSHTSSSSRRHLIPESPRSTHGKPLPVPQIQKPDFWESLSLPFSAHSKSQPEFTSSKSFLELQGSSGELSREWGLRSSLHCLSLSPHPSTVWDTTAGSHALHKGRHMHCQWQ